MLRWEGLRGLAYKALRKSIYRHVVIFELDLERFDADPRAGVPIEVRRLDESELTAYAALRPEEKSIQQRLAAGHSCFVAWHDGRIVSASWFNAERAWIPDIADSLELRRGQIYGYDSYTATDMRGLNISPALRAHAYRVLRAAGYRSALGYVQPENRANFRALDKLGFRRTGVAGLINLGSRRLRFTRRAGERTQWSRH